MTARHHNAAQQRRQRINGFSLVELLVVLVLVGLLASLVGGSVFRNLDGVKTRQAGKDLVSALRYTRGQAIVTREEQTL
ncbi:MAG: prepilin-type N-terminal cleavage/methylation domain-containing protein, partial [Pseudomonadota bacterium]